MPQYNQISYSGQARARRTNFKEVKFYGERRAFNGQTYDRAADSRAAEQNCKAQRQGGGLISADPQFARGGRQTRAGCGSSAKTAPS